MNSNDPSEEKTKTVHIEAIASAGLTNEEIPLIFASTTTALADQFGIEFKTNNVIHENSPAVPNSVPGAMGRVLLLSLNNVAKEL